MKGVVPEVLGLYSKLSKAATAPQMRPPLTLSFNRLLISSIYNTLLTSHIYGKAP